MRRGLREYFLHHVLGVCVTLSGLALDSPNTLLAPMMGVHEELSVLTTTTGTHLIDLKLRTRAAARSSVHFSRGSELDRARARRLILAFVQREQDGRLAHL